MYITTFYSFKGGVGRTMALVNVGFEFAKRGKNVLFVDFDLEAPGITTYAPFSSAAHSPGIVDYVSRYIETQEAPDVRDYMVPCTAKSNGDEHRVWLMPAGQRDEGYGSKLAGIDWQRLYIEKSGYLMFEDLKQQWAKLDPRIDYVLIDSRTGHTDVGGICTRQLPDAVTLLFFPNEQNIDGLRLVVEEINRESILLQKKINLLFCPSNVPNLDDEHNILKRRLDQARSSLGYIEPSCVVRRYDSLALLDESIFVLQRPATRLADEYRKLASALAQTNYEDREGALAVLEGIRSQLRYQRSEKNVDGAPADLAEISKTIDAIKVLYPNDGKIAWTLAAIYGFLGDFSSQIAALDVTIQSDCHYSEARFRRAVSLLGLQKADEATADLRAILKSPEASAVLLSGAIELLRLIHPLDWMASVQEAKPIIESLRFDDQLALARTLSADVRGLDLASDIARRVMDGSPNASTKSAAQTSLTLALIGGGRFEEAMGVFNPEADGKNITAVFNHSMAVWGATGRAPIDLLSRVVEELSPKTPHFRDANFQQCLSLANFLLGRRDEARTRLKRAREFLSPGSTFSCWRYLWIDRSEMEDDLDDLDRMIEGEDGVLPPFLSRRSVQLH